MKKLIPTPFTHWGNLRIGGSVVLRCACFLLAAVLFGACVDEDEFADNPTGNFEALWKIMDEHYCFFDEKGVDWDSVHTVYAQQVNNQMTESQLFEVLGNMLGTLRDGHVNLYSSFDTGRYWAFHEDYPSNYSDTLISKYLGTDYHMANGMKYRVLDDNIGYLRVASFANSFGAGNLDDMLAFMAPCNALIIDLRDNSGGMLTSAEQLAGRFTNEEIIVGYLCHKTGKGHNDFSELKAQHLKPSSGLRWQKRVAVLTNRAVYSAANEFVKYIKCCPHVIVVGDQTGGGAGLPFSSELPNGWSVRFSACPMFDRNKQSTENGIQPDYYVQMTTADFLMGFDTIIEQARRLLVE
jgi:hypothetical protein